MFVSMLKRWSAACFWVALLGGASLEAQNLGGWEDPPGGWDYVYEANDGEDVDGEFDFDFAGGFSLDGTWTHSNGSDEWDGSGPGDEFRPDGVTPASPGGAGTIIVPGAGEGGGDAEVLSIVDTGDPRPRGFPDPGSNRKTWFCHDVLSHDGVDGSFALREGLTLAVRSRLHPDVDPGAPGWQLPDGGLDNDAGQGAAPGYALRDGGKGGHGFYDLGLDRNFSFTPWGPSGYQFPPQVGEGLRPQNFLDLADNTVFHSFWIVISDEDANDRYDIVVYVDGATTPAVEFLQVDMTINNDTDCDGISHLHMGFHSTPQVGGMQVDYFGYKIGLFEPTSACPGGLAARLDSDTGQVELTWSPAAVDSYTIRRGGVVLQEGVGAGVTSFTDSDPTRPAAQYELLPIAGGEVKAGCNVQGVSVRTVVCPELACSADQETGTVSLVWTAPRFFTATGYRILRDGNEVGTAGGGDTSFDETGPPGEHTYELVVESDIGAACPVNAFCEVRIFTPGSIDVSGDGFDRVVTAGVVQIVTTTDGVKSLYFPAVQKVEGDTAAFAVEVASLGGGGDGTGGGDVGPDRFRVEIQARYSNEVRIVNLSAVPESFVHFDLSRTGVSTATDDTGTQEAVEQVPDPPGGPAVDSASSTLVNTETVGLRLVEGLNLLEVRAVDAAGTPHDDEVQLFAIRIGPFAADLDASLVSFPCASGFSCVRSVDGTVELSWSSPEPHEYELLRDGVPIASVGAGDPTAFVDNPGPGFFTYTLETTDVEFCRALTCVGGGGVPDAEGFIREWLIFGPVDWGCPGPPCDAPGDAAIEGDYIRGTADGVAVDEAVIEPVEGMEVTLDQTSIRDAPDTALNPGRPGTGTWFFHASRESLIDLNGAFGGDPGNDFMVYAVTYVKNTTGDDLTADMVLTSDDSVQVYLNDVPIHTNNFARGVGDLGSIGTPPAWDTVFDVTLEPGVNRILFKVFEGGGDTGLACRFEQLGAPVTEGLEVLLTPEEIIVDGGFVRGDVDQSGVVNLTDGVQILLHLFNAQGLPAPLQCLDAADADDSGGLNLTDGVAVFLFLFRGGSIPLPSPESTGTTTAADPSDCSPDPTGDAVECQAPPAYCG